MQARMWCHSNRGLLRLMGDKMMSMIYVAKKDTKNFTQYVNEETPESTFNSLYLPKGLPAKVLVTITEVPA